MANFDSGAIFFCSVSVSWTFGTPHRKKYSSMRLLLTHSVDIWFEEREKGRGGEYNLLLPPSKVLRELGRKFPTPISLVIEFLLSQWVDGILNQSRGCRSGSRLSEFFFKSEAPLEICLYFFLFWLKTLPFSFWHILRSTVFVLNVGFLY